MKIKGFYGTLVCASKYFTSKEMINISLKGVSDFGENKVKDLLLKKKELIDYNFTWHFIGKLQTNKIKSMINEIEYLHSLESIKQAELIQKYRIEPLKTFIQLNISEENNKSGIKISEINIFLQNLKKYDKIKIVGFMTIGVDNEPIKTNDIFKKANMLLKEYKFKELSMGMTNDYLLAIDNGTTFIRLGSFFKG